MEQLPIKNFSYEELIACLNSLDEKPFRATQIFEWIYQRGVFSFEDMRNLPQKLRERLKKDFVLSELVLIEKQVSQDGTTKFLFELNDKERIETVLIPTKTRNTVCVSTQVGCKFGCKFCASAIGGFKRNLTTAEIIEQILHVGDVTHVVFMGIGEPLDNYDAVMKSIRIINDKKALNIGARRITISTCGIIPQMKKFAQEGRQIELSVSLHGYDNESRNILMPVNRKYPFGELMQACRDYQKKTKRQITFEYVLIKEVTCTFNAATKLARAFKGLICKMNLIPYNEVPDGVFRAPSSREIRDFKKELEKLGIHVTTRISRGEDIAAACGQLRRTNFVKQK